MYYPQKKDFLQCPPDMTRHTPDFLQPYKPAMHIIQPVTLRWQLDASGPLPPTVLLQSPNG